MSSQQFCLKWNNHTNNMLNVFENLLSTEALVDVTLACDGLSLKAHKMVLSACSPFFQSLFLENPCKHPIVIMKDMSYKDLKAIIDFMYRGEVNVSQDQLSALLKTAETLKVKGLAEVSGENRQASGVVQQEVPQESQPAASASSQSGRAESPPLHGKRKRGRPRKRSLSDSARSDDDMLPSKIKDRDSPDIEELSGDASMEAGDSHRQGSNSSSQSQVHHGSSSVNFSSVNHHRQSVSSHQSAQVEEPPSGDDNEFEVEPSKLLEQTLTTDNVGSCRGGGVGTFSLPSSSGIEISQIGMSDSQALVPVSSASDSLGSTHMGGPDSPQDIKPAILTFDEPPISPVAGPSHQSDRSMMMYMDNSPMPSTSSGSFQEQALVQHDSQPQGGRMTTAWDILELYSGIKQELLSSLEKNSGFRPFKCQLCSYTTFVPEALTQHVHTHCIDRPYKCPICLKGFTQKGSVQLHMLHHTGERPHKCPVCGRCYSQKGSMRRHIIQHLDSDTNKCPLCSEIITERIEMETHLIQHTKKDSFYCCECNATFPSAEVLHEHKENNHS